MPAMRRELESTTVSAGTVHETAAGDLAATLGGLTSGDAFQGTAVSVATVTDNGADVLLSSTTSYQWQVLSGTSWTTVGTGTSYTPIQADEGKALRVVVTYAGDAAGSESTTVSAGTVQDITGGDLLATLGGLTAGNAFQDTAVSVTAVTHAGADVRSDATYQWQVLDGTSWTDISGATNASYTPVEGDEGKALQVVVHYTDESTIVSAGVIQEIAAGDLLATLGGLTAGNAVHGTAVSVAAVTDNGADVLSEANYSWQVSTNGIDWTPVSNISTYTPTEGDEGKALQVVVTYAGDAAGLETTTVSAGTVQEIAAGDLLATLGGLTAGNAVHGTAVSVAAVTDNGADVHSIASYQWQLFNGTSWTTSGATKQATPRPRATKARRCRWW